MNAQLNVVFFGNEKLATGIDDTPIILPALIAEGYHISALVLSQKPSSRDTSSMVAEIASQYAIPIIYWNNTAQILDELQSIKADLAVVVAFGRIIGVEVLSYFKGKVLNIHPSLLPRYRGPSPIEQTILSGDQQTGVSVIELGQGVDDGPILAQKEITITDDVTKQELTTLLKNEGYALLHEIMPDYYSDDLPKTKQDNSQATFTQKITPNMRSLDFNQTAAAAERAIRAFAGWPSSCVYFGDKILTILSAKTSNKPSKKAGMLFEENNQLYISFSDACLQVRRLKLAGRAAIDARSFINGYSHIKQSAIPLETSLSNEE